VFGGVRRTRVRGGACFGLGLASFAADTRQSSGEKAGGDIDFAAFYILPVPSSLSAKWRRVKIGSLPSFSPSLRMPPKHPLRSRAANPSRFRPRHNLFSSRLDFFVLLFDGEKGNIV